MSAYIIKIEGSSAITALGLTADSKLLVQYTAGDVYQSDVTITEADFVSFMDIPKNGGSLGSRLPKILEENLIKMEKTFVSIENFGTVHAYESWTGSFPDIKSFASKGFRQLGIDELFVPYGKNENPYTNAEWAF